MKRFIPYIIIFSSFIVSCQTINSLNLSPTPIEISSLIPPATTTIPTLEPTETDDSAKNIIVPTIHATEPFSITEGQLTDLVSISPECKNINLNVEFPETSFNQFPGTLLAFLNAGGNPTDITDYVENNNFINQYDDSFWIGDLTVSGKLDIVISLQDNQKQTIPPSGMFLIFLCQEEEYQIELISIPDTPEGIEKIIFIKDLNNDYIPDIITSNSYCGAHTCFEKINILSWDGLAFINRLNGSTTSLPFPSLKLVDLNDDDVFDLEITSSGFGSVGAGPQRPNTQVWSFEIDTHLWNLSDEYLGPSNFRIHVLHDADDSLDKGEYQVANVLYELVISDNNLDDWLQPEMEKSFLRTYAQYKQMVTQYLIGNIDLAQLILNTIGNEVSEEDRRHPILQMAIIFMNEANENGTTQGCDAAIEFAENNKSAVFGPLGSGTYGYAQKEVPPESVCPGSN